jgi:carbamoyl-phosphate synthase large subunit
MDVVLSPEMKSTGEAIGYDKDLNKALYKSLKARGQRLVNYGTVFVTIADIDKAQALPLIKRFYELGFNIEATKGTAKFLKENGIRTRIREKISQGSEEILDSLRKGYVSYVVNTMTDESISTAHDGVKIRRCAIDNNIPVFTCLDTVDALPNVLEGITMNVSTIDSEE